MIDAGRIEDALVLSSLFLTGDDQSNVQLNIALEFMFKGCWIRAIELLTSMGRLIDVIRFFIHTNQVEMAFYLGLVVLEFGLYDLDKSFSEMAIYNMVLLPESDKRRFPNLREMLRSVFGQYEAILASLGVDLALASLAPDLAL